MPRPWKISNLDHRVSRFVSDLRCSSKHGESLVVQTGFPTSLVDLFVKNRDRMNKRNSRKKTKHRHVPSHEIFSDPVSSPLISDPGSPSPLNALYSNREILVSQKAIEEEILSGDSDLALEMMREEEEEEEEDEQHQQQHQPQEKLDDDDNCAVPNRVLKKLSLSIFLMLILALGTNKLALLITLSAFFLIFLEFAGKRFLCLSGARTKVYVQVEKVIDSIQLENSSNYFISTPSLDEEVNDDDTPSPPPPPPPFLEDLHLLKQPLHLEEEEEEEDHYIDQNRNTTATIQETDNDVFQSAKMASSRRSKSAKLSAKSVKKFVLKKMGGSYKKRKQKRVLQEECDTTNIINLLQEEKVIQPNCCFIQEEEEIRAIINNCLVREEKKRSLINNGLVQVEGEEEDDEDDNEEEEEEKEEAERLSKDGEDNEMEVDGTSDYSDQVHVCRTSDYSENSELSVDISVEESLGRRTKWNLEHCTKWRLEHSIPVVVSLVGLVGGRLIALGLTLGWFLWVNHHRLNHHKPRREEIRDDRGAPRYLV